MSLDANNRNHGEPGTDDAGQYQIEREREAVVARASDTAKELHRKRTLASVAALTDKQRDHEAAMFINVTATLAKKHDDAKTVSFVVDARTNKLAGVDVNAEDGKWLGSVKLADVYDTAEPGYEPGFTGANLHGCFDEEDKGEVAESPHPSFSVSVDAAESVDPGDAGSLAPQLEKTLELIREEDAGRFVDKVREIEPPEHAAELVIVSEDDTVLGARWVNEDYEEIAELDGPMLELVKTLNPEALVTASGNRPGVSVDWDELNERDEFRIKLGPIKPYPVLGQTR